MIVVKDNNDMNNNGNIPELPLTEYDKFRVIHNREIMIDFDKQLKLLFGDKN